MKRLLSMLLALAMLCGAACAEGGAATSEDARAAIEAALNLANNPEQAWSYDAENDAWTLSVVSAVVNPVIPEEEAVCLWILTNSILWRTHTSSSSYGILTMRR